MEFARRDLHTLVFNFSHENRISLLNTRFPLDSSMSVRIREGERNVLIIYHTHISTVPTVLSLSIYTDRPIEVYRRRLHVERKQWREANPALVLSASPCLSASLTAGPLHFLLRLCHVNHSRPNPHQQQDTAIQYSRKCSVRWNTVHTSGHEKVKPWESNKSLY